VTGVEAKASKPRPVVFEVKAKAKATVFCPQTELEVKDTPGALRTPSLPYTSVYIPKKALTLRQFKTTTASLTVNDAVVIFVLDAFVNYATLKNEVCVVCTRKKFPITLTHVYISPVVLLFLWETGIHHLWLNNLTTA